MRGASIVLFDMPLEKLKTYLPPREEPPDFDSFWEQTLAEVRRFPLPFLSWWTMA